MTPRKYRLSYRKEKEQAREMTRSRTRQKGVTWNVRDVFFIFYLALKAFFIYPEAYVTAPTKHPQFLYYRSHRSR